MRKSTIIAAFLVAGAACAPSRDDAAPEEISEEMESTEVVTTRDDVQEELSEAYDAVRGYTHAQQEELVSFSRERLSELEATLDDLEGDMEHASDETREAWVATRDKIARERVELEKRIAELEDSSADAWTDVKSAMLDALENLERGVDEATAEFQEKESSAS